MQFEYLTTFCAFLESGCSLKSTALSCHTTPLVIRKRIRNLEIQLGTHLVYSRNKQLKVTKSGQQFYERIKLYTSCLKNTLEEVKQERDTIRLSSTQTFITCWHKNFLNSFFQKYPKIEVVGIDKPIDLVESNHDIFIGSITDEIGRNEIYRKLLCKFHLMLCASTEYLEKYGVPKSTEDLKHHHLICYTEDPSIYTFQDPNHLFRDIRLGDNYIRLNGGYNIVQAIENGWGIGPISIESAMSSKVDVIPILTESVKPQAIDIYCFSRNSFDSDAKIHDIYNTIKNDVDKQLTHIQKKYKDLTGSELYG